MTAFATKAALPLIDQAYEGPEPHTLETYYPPDQSESVKCTTDEREDFEREHEVALTEDVISDQRDYDSLVRYLAENCKLGKL